MPHDTIPEHSLSLESDSEPPPPRREPTGRHRAAQEDLEEHIGAVVERAVKRQAPSQAKAIAAIVLASLGAGGGFYGVSSYEAGRREARMTEQLVATDRRLDGLERQVEGIGALSRDMAALTAKVDAWRAADLASRASERADLERRLTRLEELLDRRR